MEEEKVVLEATNETNEVANENKPNEAPKGEQKENRRFPSNRRQNSKRDGKRVEKRDENNGFSDRVVFINRVSKTVKGGRRMKFTALVAVGNGEGQYGFALAKAAEVPDAVKKAKEAAMKKLYNVHLVKGHTISHEIVGKYGACSVLLKPAPEGTGIIAGGPVRAILELAGVQNVCSKVYGSRAPINIIRAVNQGLENLKSYKNVMSLRNKE